MLTKPEVIKLLERDGFMVKDTKGGWIVSSSDPNFVPLVGGRYTAATHKSAPKNPKPFLGDLKKFFGWTPTHKG